jgi:hypothetical protein
MRSELDKRVSPNALSTWSIASRICLVNAPVRSRAAASPMSQVRFTSTLG